MTQVININTRDELTLAPTDKRGLVHKIKVIDYGDQ